MLSSAGAQLLMTEPDKNTNSDDEMTASFRHSDSDVETAESALLRLDTEDKIPGSAMNTNGNDKLAQSPTETDTDDKLAESESDTCWEEYLWCKDTCTTALHVVDLISCYSGCMRYYVMC